MKSSKCKTSKSKSRKKKMASGTSRTKWIKTREKGGRWCNDHPMVRYSIDVTPRYKIYAYQQETPKKFGGPQGWNWQLRDKNHYTNLVLPGHEGSWTTLKECKRRAMLAYLLWFTIKLLRKTDDPRKIGNEFYDV